ncbi:MAG: hypothetical protein IKU07_01555 [Oscillospiraceae bacterium]|nr:hypothetical protein [Oscillospiraceae bacterium]
MKENHRMATWWIHWEDLNWPAQHNLDKIRRRAAAFAEANISAAVIFGAHFRWDFLPMFPLLHDYIATVAEELHKYHIKLFDHHSVNLVHRYRTREEMRRVMRDSGPHLPFCPTWEAAATWEFHGKRLNDWRMIDVKNGEPYYFPQYTGEGFCHRNPEFIEAYKEYLQLLISDTGIDGLSADDAMYYGAMNTCGCKHCRAELKRRSGIDLPPVEDLSFWGNWDNEAWHHWLDLRREATGEFYEEIAGVLPDGFMLTGCGSGSASVIAVLNGTDARQFLRGCNYVNLEMVGNTPPYKHDPHTVNEKIARRLITASHHQAAAREKGVRAFNTGFAHVPETANIAWAASKLLGADAWIMALKPRLGLPREILETLPDEEDILGDAFGFEKEHPELFSGNFVGQMGVFFSEETRDHTMFGCLGHGYTKDFGDMLSALFREGICPHTVFSFPENGETYPLILVPSAAKMTAAECAALQRYADNGGKVIITGPTPVPGCENSWRLPNAANVPASDFFTTCPDGIRPVRPAWIGKTPIPECADPNCWQQVGENIFYHPHRMPEDVVARCRSFSADLPVKLVEAKGYLCTMFETEDSLTVHFLAEDYDTDIDHKLDEMRFHRSRVNFINKVEPVGISGVLKLEAHTMPQVFTPFHEEQAGIVREENIYTVNLPDKCAYAILRFPK